MSKIMLQDLLTIIPPATYIRVIQHDKEDMFLQDKEEIFNGFSGNATFLDDKEITTVKLHPEFYRRDVNLKRMRVAVGEEIPINSETADQYNYCDLTMKLYTDIYVAKNKEKEY